MPPSPPDHDTPARLTVIVALAREVADSAVAGGRRVTRPIDEQSHPAIANIPYY
jgi:hypothetical protein